MISCDQCMGLSPDGVTSSVQQPVPLINNNFILYRQSFHKCSIHDQSSNSINLDEFFHVFALLSNDEDHIPFNPAKYEEEKNHDSTDICIGNKISYTDLDQEQLEFDYVESSLNYPGNYQNYVSRVIDSMKFLSNIDYSDIIEKKALTLHNGDPAKKTLILDLDETLAHADFNRNYKECDYIISFLYKGSEVTVPIILRPGVIEFLENISENFEIFIFTASIKEYADAVLNLLDPLGKIFKCRFYRESCISIKDKIFIKDLAIFKNRRLEDVIIVDNNLYSFCNQISNGVLINSFFNDKDDRELFNLFNYLNMYISNASDVREVNEKVFNFNSFLKDNSTVNSRDLEEKYKGYNVNDM
jgi:Dullard-like phosphatase family protein